MSYSIVLVDQQRLLRDGIKTLLQGSNFEVVGEAEAGDVAVPMCSRLHPDVVVMEMVLPGRDGLQVAQAIRRVSPGTGVVFLTEKDDEESMDSAVLAGARGFLAKRASGEELMRAVQRVVLGGYYLGRRVGRRMLPPPRLHYAAHAH